MSVVDLGLMARLQHAVDEQLPEGLRVDVLDGTIFVNPPGSLNHTELIEQLGIGLRGCVPAGLRVAVAGAGIYEHDEAEAEYQQPDVVVYRRPDDPAATRLTGADVELVGEVVSPANRRLRDYEEAVVERAVRYGIPWVLIVDPEARTVRWWHDGAEQPAGPAWAGGLSPW